MTKEDYRSQVDSDKRTLQDECSGLQEKVQTMIDDIEGKSYFDNTRKEISMLARAKELKQLIKDINDSIGEV